MKFKDVLKEGFGKEIIIYGIKKGDPDYMSDIIMVWPKGKPKPTKTNGKNKRDRKEERL